MMSAEDVLGFINWVKKIPIQMCLFHQKAIIRRYITDNPRSSFGKDLKQVMHLLCYSANQNLIKNSLISFIDSKINIIIL